MFNVILVDIENTYLDGKISCVKKNMHDEDLEYIAISYRWGELDEQVIETPDYTAHIKSFDIDHLLLLCGYMYFDEDLKKIPYLWIDAISVDQQNYSRKKETILQMSEIYKRAACILAVPDLHYTYLRMNPENEDVLALISEYSRAMGDKITKMFDQTNDDGDDDDDGDIKKIYRFLAYLVQDWANRAWVISEYQIAKEKKEEYGIPMKYTFMSLANESFPSVLRKHPFFSYSFDHDDININNNNDKNNNLSYTEVDDGRKFIKFLKNVLTQRSYLDMLLNSKASRNEDRFNAILPSWKKYSDVIKDKNTVSSWQITNMVSVRLKLYEIMDDLWDKARLLYACSHHSSPGFPTFAMHYDNDYIYLKEVDGDDTFINFGPNGECCYVKERKGFTTGTSLSNVSDNEINHSTKDELNSSYRPYKIKNEQMQIDRPAKVKQFTNNVVPDNIRDSQMGDANLIDIQLNNHGKYGHPYLTMKSKFCYYYILDKKVSDRLKSKYPLKDADRLICVRIPFFIPGESAFNGGIFDISDVYLLGDENKNRWIVSRCRSKIDFEDWTFIFIAGYTFNVH